MNVERLLALADILDRGGVGTVGFDMQTYYCRGNPNGVCGTTACIAGHAVLTFGTEAEVQSSPAHYGGIATKLLGFEVIPALFFLYEIRTPYEAAWLIRTAIKRDISFDDPDALYDLAREARGMRHPKRHPKRRRGPRRLRPGWRVNHE